MLPNLQTAVDQTSEYILTGTGAVICKSCKKPAPDQKALTEFCFNCDSQMTVTKEVVQMQEEGLC